VTFTATVSLTSSSGTPTGTVTFKDGSTTLGSSPLSGGSASYSTSSLATGGHSISAVYSGVNVNSRFNGFNGFLAAQARRPLGQLERCVPILIDALLEVLSNTPLAWL
jgi:hypothetical protein